MLHAFDVLLPYLILILGSATLLVALVLVFVNALERSAERGRIPEARARKAQPRAVA
jgi:hypothetical protein